MSALRKRMTIVLVVLSSVNLLGQNTVGLINYEYGNQEGYVLFSPMPSTHTYLIDKCGEKVHEWNTSNYRPALSCYLLEDGSLLRTGQLDNAVFDEGGSGGIIERFDWNGNLTWSYTLSNTDNCLHHDILPLPNGNILCIVWDRHTKAEGVANGMSVNYSNSHIWSEKLIELQPQGANGATVVWEWRLWDHLVQDDDPSKPNYGVVADHPELVDINYFPTQVTTSDWVHLNSVDYNAALDQIVVSSHTFNEVWILDHSTTTAQAASHIGGNAGKGGDLLYRWGNPQAYDRGTPPNKKLFGQHHATWMPEGYPNEGKLLVFNNGLGRPGNYSSIDMIDPPLMGYGYTSNATDAYLPTDLFWTYTAETPSDFYSSNISGVYPLENGSFLITSGREGEFFEIDEQAETVWRYVNPVIMSGPLAQGSIPSNNLVFRANFYPTDYEGLQGHSLEPLGTVELNPSEPSLCSVVQAVPHQSASVGIEVFPNPVSDVLTVSATGKEVALIFVTDMSGREVLSVPYSPHVDVSSIMRGVYIVSVRTVDSQFHNFRVIRN